MGNERFVYLEISSWQGISIGAIHYYGDLVGYINGEFTKIELQRKLTRTQAETMNRERRKAFPGERDSFVYRQGMETKSFETKQEIIDHALKVWQERFPVGKILIRGNISTGNPQEVLVAPEPFKSEVNALWQEDERIGGYEGNAKRSEAIFRQYQKLLKELAVQP